MVAVRVWDVDRDREVARLPGRAGDSLIRVFAISPDGKTIALGLDDGSIVVWDCRTGRVRGPYRQHRPGFSAEGLEFAPDGATLAAVGRFTDHGPTIAHLRTRLDIAFRNRPVKEVWEVILLDVPTGRRLRRADWEAAPTFSPDGRVLATTDETYINVRTVPGRR